MKVTNFMIDYQFLSLKKGLPAKDYWDMGLIHHILQDHRFRETPLKIGGIIIFPAKEQIDKVDELNKFMEKLKWVVLLLTSDEESVFPVEKIRHPNIKIYVMYPKRHHEGIGYLLTGFPPQARHYLGKEYIKPDKNWFFAGQITHTRRQEFYLRAKHFDDGGLIKTEGFTQGLEFEEYYKKMQEAKVLPAPSGPVSADSFRLAEALEAGRIPIADTVDKEGTGYWDYFFGYHPFPVIEDYGDLRGYIDDQLEGYTGKSNKIYAWWQQYKHNLKHKLIEETINYNEDKLTVVIPVSPIPSHPDTRILDETIRTIKVHLPEAEIYITFDGVRKEQEHLKKDYEEFVAHALWKCNFEWNAIPFVFEEHLHQSGMMREIIDKIKTPHLLYVEQDTPLTPDTPIDFEMISSFIESGKSDVVRLHFESVIPEDHEHLMIGKDGDFIKTVQWSQRPHVSSVAFYQRILRECFSDEAKSFIEDVMHGKVMEAFKIHGIDGWNQYKIHIYSDAEGYLKRSYHTDGREGAEKYDTTQVF